MSQPLQIIPLGGLGEIGKNMMVMECAGEMLLVDAGIMFPDVGMHGVDLVLPDYSYLNDKFDRIKAIIVTHGHEDHIGALPYLLDNLSVPIYGTPLTIGMLRSKLPAKMRETVDTHAMQAGERVAAGPFDVEFFRVNHSIPDGVGLAIRTPCGLIVHSGDFKFDYTPVIDQPADLGRLAELGHEGVLALLSDSTNSESPGFTPSERSVQPTLDSLFQEAPGRIILTTFASHLPRIQQVIWLAAEHGRNVGVAGRSMVDNIRIASELGYLSIPEGLLRPVREVIGFPPQRVVVLATGSQGEPTAALSRMALGTHGQVRIRAGDTVIISAHPVPGNEEEASEVINRLLKRGANVVYDRIAPVHVSGHASQEEQRLLMKLVRPRYFIPIHGELRHLHAHGRTAREMGLPAENVFVVENGYTLEFDPAGTARVGPRVPGGYVYVDGSRIGDIGPAVLRDREMLSQDGFVIISVSVNARTGEPLSEPEFISRGFVYMRESAALIEEIKALVIDWLREPGEYEGREAVSDFLKGRLGRVLHERTHRRPMILAVVSEFDPSPPSE